MAEDKISVKFVNCTGSDINIYIKKDFFEKYMLETCLPYNVPELILNSHNYSNTTWKFFDHLTKRNLLGNGKEIFHCQQNECTPLIVKITTPLYTLKELCNYTISTRIFANNISNTKIDEMNLPEKFKIDIKSCVKKLEEMYEAEGKDFFQDWTVYHE